MIWLTGTGINGSVTARKLPFTPKQDEQFLLLPAGLRHHRATKLAKPV